MHSEKVFFFILTIEFEATICWHFRHLINFHLNLMHSAPEYCLKWNIRPECKQCFLSATDRSDKNKLKSVFQTKADREKVFYLSINPFKFDADEYTKCVIKPNILRYSVLSKQCSQIYNVWRNNAKEFMVLMHFNCDCIYGNVM